MVPEGRVLGFRTKGGFSGFGVLVKKVQKSRIPEFLIWMMTLTVE